MIAQLMGLRVVSPSDLSGMIERGEADVFDVNAPQRWRDAHVPGARNLDPTQFEPAALPADKARPVGFYCSGPLCRKAPNAAVRARKLGHSDVRVLSAGISGWLAAGLPTESGG